MSDASATAPLLPGVRRSATCARAWRPAAEGVLVRAPGARWCAAAAAAARRRARARPMRAALGQPRSGAPRVAAPRHDAAVASAARSGPCSAHRQHRDNPKAEGPVELAVCARKQPGHAPARRCWRAAGRLARCRAGLPACAACQAAAAYARVHRGLSMYRQSGLASTSTRCEPAILKLQARWDAIIIRQPCALHAVVVWYDSAFAAGGRASAARPFPPPLPQFRSPSACTQQTLSGLGRGRRGT